MIELVHKHPVPVIVSAFLLGAVLVAAVWGIATAVTARPSAAPSARPAPPSSAPSTRPTPTPSTAPVVGCGSATTTVRDATELRKALAAASAGDVIAMAPGTYDGEFTASVSGTAGSPITLCGSADAILDGGDPDHGYVLHLDHASYWRLAGFTVTNGQKGVMADGTVGSVIQGLTVHHVGDEAIHLRDQSTDNTVTGNTVSDTGLRKPQFGEGIYIGTANSNWCDVSDCKEDASDRNVVEKNTISGTTAESVDIKEGTSHGVLRDNTFDGTGMTEADSWVDVKGNDWTIQGNTGRNSPEDGFQTHDVYEGWGTDNVFRANSADVNGPGYGFHLAPVNDNVVVCGNSASAAGKGLSNVSCSSG